jgi:hypothetical protein
MSERRIEPGDTAWKRSYPAFRDPLPGESLAGFMLALDALNGFDAGQTYRLIRRHAVGASGIGPGYFLSGACFNLGELAALAGGTSQDGLLGLTLQPLLAWLFPDWRGGSTTIGQRLGFRVCPPCFQDDFVSVTSLHDHFEGCARHGVRLVDRCRCPSKAPIRLFARQDPGRCHAPFCGMRYADLEEVPLDALTLDRTRRAAATFEDLIAFAATAPEPLPRRQMFAGLRTLLATAGVIPSVPVRAAGDLSLSVILTILAETAQGAASLDQACRSSSGGISRRTPAAPQRAEGACPGASCNGASEVSRDGHLKTLGERQYVCTRCGTRFTRSRVLFAFDDLPDYPTWRSVRNRRKLQGYRSEVTAACRKLQQPKTYLGIEAIFASVGVPSSAPYQSERAGLAAIVDRSNVAAGARRRRPARQLRLATAVP